MNGAISAAQPVSPMVPLPVQLLCTLLLCLALRKGLQDSQSRSNRFVVISLWVRLIVSNFHFYTAKSLGPGLSINSLVTIGIVGFGVLLIRRRLLGSVILLPFIPFLASVVISGIINHNLMEGLDTIMRILFCAVLSMHCYESLRTTNVPNFIRITLLGLSPALVFGLAALATRTGKFSEFDSSYAFVGGYGHESLYSMILIAVMAVVILAPNMRLRISLPLMGVTLLLLMLANYRTAILACGPALLYFAIQTLTRLIPRNTRAIVAISVGIVLAGGAILFVMASPRFADLSNTIADISGGMKDPASVPMAERKLLSGRYYIWTTYYDGWKHADALHQTVGFGPDAWKERFPLYAHNTFFHYLFETGVLGLMSLLLMFFSMLIASFSARPSEKLKLVALNFTFLVLNMATMPLFQVEGLMALGIIWGWTAASFLLKGHDRPVIHHPIGPPGPTPHLIGLRA